MPYFSRRRFVTLAAGAAGLACVPRKLLGNFRARSPRDEKLPSHQKMPPSEIGEFLGAQYLLVAMPDAGAGAEVPYNCRTQMHACYPSRQQPCWCGNWHAPADPFDLVLIVGTPPPSVRLSPKAVGILILPRGVALIDCTAMNYARCPTCDFGPWAARAVEQASEPFLYPGLIGTDFSDLRALLSSSTELRLDYATSPRGILESGTAALERARPWLAATPNLLIRIAGTPDLTLEDVNTVCTTIHDAAHPDVNIIFTATITDENVVGVMGG